MKVIKIKIKIVILLMWQDEWDLLIPRVFDDPRSCQIDGHVISTYKGS